MRNQIYFTYYNHSYIMSIKRTNLHISDVLDLNLLFFGFIRFTYTIR